MRVFLAGATGFIGRHLLGGLRSRGHEVTALMRPSAKARAVIEGVAWVSGAWLAPDTWLPALEDHDAVIHAVGLIRESRYATFDAVQAEVPIQLHAAAQGFGITKLAQISALGAVDEAPTRFLQSKRQADRNLEASRLGHLILRPSLVYGPGDHSMAFFERLARLPLVPLPDGGAMQIQPIHVGDVVRAALDWLEGSRPSGTFDIGGGEALTFREVLIRLASARLNGLPIPPWAMDLVARFTDLTRMGPITRDELMMLRGGSTCDNGPFIDAFGFEPLPFSRGLLLRHQPLA